MQRFKNIICVMNAGLEDRSALERAILLATSNQAELTVIEVIEKIPASLKQIDSTLWPANFFQQRLERHRLKLNELVATLHPGIRITTQALSGIPFLEVIQQVLRNGHDLVIKNAEDSGLVERLFGSDDMQLMRKCPCPVWLFKPQARARYKRILVAVDVDDYYPKDELAVRNQLNLKILGMASSLASIESAELNIVYVSEAIAEDLMNKGFIGRSDDEKSAYVDRVTERSLQSLQGLMGLVTAGQGASAASGKPRLHVLRGYPRQQVSALANQIRADLVVMGSVARTGISGFFMGNTAETILNQLHCSVLTVKPDGFVTPVTLEPSH